MLGYGKTSTLEKKIEYFLKNSSTYSMAKSEIVSNFEGNKVFLEIMWSDHPNFQFSGGWFT